jgi:hypothetical protein
MAENTASREAAQERRVKAEAMFQERCKKSGVFIYRTAENVEGVFLLKLRPDEKNYGDQYKLDDPYGRDLGGEGYIQTFLRGQFQASTTGVGRPGSPQYLGYLYVDAIDPQDGKRYRYTGSIKEVTHTSSILMGGDGKTTFKRKEFVLDKIPAPDPVLHYGVTYEDISTREERGYWIAGSLLKVIDLQTNEVMAERIGYMMDRGQGNNSGGRAPWLYAADHACPSFNGNPSNGGGASAQAGQTRRFVTQVIKPSPEH